MLARAAQWLEGHGARLVDINMGCPQRKISTHGAGAGLLRKPDEAVRLAEQVVKAVSIPVTVKLRLGWDFQTLVAHDMVPRLEAAGVAAITIHGRTRSQGYTGQADLDQIRKVVQSATRIPVIGNGDITSPATARNMFNHTGCAAIMVGRGAMKNPWLLRDIRNDLKGLPPASPPTREDWVRFALGHFDRMVELYGPKGATLLYREWIPQYLRRLLAGRQHLVTMMMIEEAPLMRNAIEDLFQIRPVEVPASLEDRAPSREDEDALLEGRGAFIPVE
jgi:nifR3 family TIM-barrel protein